MPTVFVFKAHYLVMRPVKVICDEGYLLVQLIEGVASYPPKTLISA